MADVLLSDKQKQRLGAISYDDPVWDIAQEVLQEMWREKVDGAMGPDYTPDQRAWECGHAHGLDQAVQMLEGLREQCS